MNGSNAANMAAAQGGGGGYPSVTPQTMAAVQQGLTTSTAGTPFAGYNPFAPSQNGPQGGAVAAPTLNTAYTNVPSGFGSVNSGGSYAPLAAFSQAVGGLGQYMPAAPSAIQGMSAAQAAQLANWQPSVPVQQPVPTFNVAAAQAPVAAAPAPAPAPAALPASAAAQGVLAGPEVPGSVDTAGGWLPPGQIDPGGNWDAGPTG